MDIKIEGNPGTGNSFHEYHINNVETFAPNATNVTIDRSVTVQISFSLNINLNGEKAISLFKTLQRKFHLTFEKLQSNPWQYKNHSQPTLWQPYSHSRF